MSEYEKSVQAMCARLGIKNPIEDESVLIQEVAFGYPEVGTLKTIKLTDMNRAGMVFLQEEFSSPGIFVLEANLEEHFQAKCIAHFAERWWDTERMNRSMIKALKGANRIKIIWRAQTKPR